MSPTDLFPTVLLPADFHFLRPAWLFAIVPAVLLVALAWRRIGTGRTDWARVVDAHLLRHLALRDPARGTRWPLLALLLALVLAALAMAGPTWQRLPTPALDGLDPTVVVLSLAPSMNANDQNPTRLMAARHKVDDILARMRGGQVGLVIYADAPFVASPLTEDGRVVAQMLPELSTDLMPVRDDRPDLALRTAVNLLKNAGAKAGRIVLLADGLGERAAQTLEAARMATEAGYSVSVIGIGSSNAGPLNGPDGKLLRGRNGTPLSTRMDEPRLSQLAAAGGGNFSRITADDRDLDTVFAEPAVTSAASRVQLRDSGLVADQWRDMGPWIVIAVAALASLAFRRGWLAVVVLGAALAGTGSGAPARAQGLSSTTLPAWPDLWKRPDQQGADAFRAQDFDAAKQQFTDPAWQASALYKAGDFANAATTYARVPGADYNRGNALARAGQLEEAVKAYDAALAQTPDHRDAAYNRDLVQRLIDAKKQQDQKDKDQKDNKGGGQDKDQKDNKGGSGDKNKDQKDNKDNGQGDQPQKPDQPGGDQKQDAKDQPDPKGAPPKEPDPKAPNPAKPDPAKPDPSKPDPAKPDPAKPDPAKPDPAKSDPAKPEPGKPPEAPGNGTQPEFQPPPPSPPPAPPPAGAAPGQQGQAAPPPPKGPETQVVRPLTEQDQAGEQTLRMVPDDPTGLLRARIRSHYLGTPVQVAPPNAPAGAPMRGQP